LAHHLRVMAPRTVNDLGVRLDTWQARYAVALVTVGLAWLAREEFLPAATERSPFVAFGLAILITSLASGFGPGILATSFSSIIAVMFYLPPYVALEVHAPFDVALLTLFILEGVIASFAGGVVRRAMRPRDDVPSPMARFARFLERAETLRGHLTSDAPPLTDPLTPRELEVARLLALGLSNDQIAEAMFISRNTTKTHLKRIYEKVGAQTRTEAVARCIELGLLDVLPDSDAARYVIARRGDPEAGQVVGGSSEAPRG
jgi:DNA-binding CsgD family transcriptional regulator